MKGTAAFFDHVNGRQIAALRVDGRLEDLIVEPPEDRIRPGTILRGKATRAAKGQGGVFLDTPRGRVFLRKAKGISEGQSLIVQAISYAEPGKATPVTERVVFKSRYCLITPRAPGLNISREIRDEERRVELTDLVNGLNDAKTNGLVLRTSSANADDDAIAEDVSQMLELAGSVLAEKTQGAPEVLLDGPNAHELAWRDWPVPDVTDAEQGSLARNSIDEEIEALREPPAQLEGGAWISIEPTRAFVAIDVNTGSDTSLAAGLKANTVALSSLPRHLRLRGLGGQIVVDCAPMPKRDRVRVDQVASRAFRKDTIETSVVGWTPLGHLELQRKRERCPLSECLP